MKKYLLGFFFVLLMSVLVTSQHEKYAHNSAAPGQDSSSSIISPDNPQKTTHTTKQPQHYPPSWLALAYELFGWPKGITVWALFLTMVVIAEQTRAAMISARAAQDGAKTALEQTQMIKSKEHARLMVKVTSGPEIGEPEPLIDNYQLVTAKVFVVNVGPTKAYNVEAFGELIITSRIDKTPWNEGLRQEIPATIGNTDDGVCIPIAVSSLGVIARAGGFTTLDGRAFDQVAIGKIKRGEVFFQVNGLLTYDDVYGDSHRTPFKLIWQRLGISTDPSWPEEWDWIDDSPKST